MFTRSGIFLPYQGRNEVKLNWTIPQGTGYQLFNNTSGGLAINNAGANYPYPGTGQYNGMLSITGPTNPNPQVTNYNYFYNWKIACKGCTSTKDTLWVRTKLGPKVDLGADTSACSFPPLQLDATPGMTSYLWNTGATTQKITVETSGTYKVSVTSGTGCLITDTIKVLVTPSPSFTINDTSLCEGLTDTLTTKLSPVFFIHSWNIGTSDTYALATTPGKYIVTVYDAFNFCSKTDTADVSFIPNPVVNLGKDGVRCGSSITIDATPGGGSYAYLWDDASTNATRSVSADGFYYVQVTDNSTQCKGSDSVDIQLKSNPVVNLGPDTNVCGLNITMSGPTGADYAYLWKTSQISQNINVTTPGMYWLEVKDTVNSCSKRDTINITFAQVPNAEIGADIVQCNGTVTISAPPCAGCNYLWTPSSATTSSATFDQTNNGTIKVLVSNNCYVSNDSLKLDIQSPPVIDLLPSFDIVSCGNVQLSATSAPAGKNITWTGGIKGNTILAEKSGSYSVAVSNVCGTVNKTAQVKIDVPATADFTINYPGTPLTIGLIDNSTDASEYSWDFGDGNSSTEINPVHTYSREGIFAVTLTVKNKCGVKSTTKYTLKIQRPTTAIQDNISNTGVKVYPNPASSIVTLEVSGVKDGSYRIEVRDMTGKKVMEDKVQSVSHQLKKQFDITQLSAGQYQVIFSDKDGRQLQRSIIVE